MDLIERMIWDTKNGQILDEERRYVMLRADVLMGIFNQLPDAERQQALHSFMNSVKAHGSNSVAAYWLAINKNPQVLLDTMIRISAQLGWGAWQICKYTPQELTIEVINSPFAKASIVSQTPVCTPILGIMESMGSFIFNGPVQVLEHFCHAQPNHSKSCLFIIKPVAHV
ncbi:hypothetical protein [Paenalcaligenes hermetiae]|uniref:4-vinyl reductase 4VR domain-containing protein n=1 Tax=Paenalcaligenes hermetiae TaxID=1157987 RepID=A0ABP9M9X0_9BURK